MKQLTSLTCNMFNSKLAGPAIEQLASDGRGCFKEILLHMLCDCCMGTQPQIMNDHSSDQHNTSHYSEAASMGICPLYSRLMEIMLSWYKGPTTAPSCMVDRTPAEQRGTQ